MNNSNHSNSLYGNSVAWPSPSWVPNTEYVSDNYSLYPSSGMISSIGYGWSPWTPQTPLSVENLNQWDSNLRWAIGNESALLRQDLEALKKQVFNLQEELNRTHNSSEEVCGHTQDGRAADDQGGVRAVSPGVTLTFGQGASDYFIR